MATVETTTATVLVNEPVTEGNVNGTDSAKSTAAIANEIADKAANEMATEEVSPPRAATAGCPIPRNPGVPTSRK